MQKIEQKNKNNFIDIVWDTIKWFTFERAFGLSLLFVAGMYAIEPLRENTILQIFISNMNIDTSVVAMWYTLSGIYLIKIGNKVSSFYLLLCFSPVLLNSFAHITQIISPPKDVIITADNIATEFIIALLMIQRLTTKLASEIFYKINNP
jgi:hypothetical protein